MRPPSNDPVSGVLLGWGWSHLNEADQQSSRPAGVSTYKELRLPLGRAIALGDDESPLAEEIYLVLKALARSPPSVCEQLRLLGSTPVACGASRQTAERSELTGSASYGYCAAHSR